MKKSRGATQKAMAVYSTTTLAFPKIGFLKSIFFLSHALRSDAGDRLRLLEDGLAGEHGGHRNGDKPGGSGQGGY